MRFVIATTLVILIVVCAVQNDAGTTEKKRSLLDKFLNRLTRNQNHVTRSTDSKKQLIMVSFPGGVHEKYNKGELGPNWCEKINYFFFTYAMAAKRIGDDFLIFYPDTLPKTCFDPELFACSNAYLLPIPEECAMDIWMRDFTSVNKKNPVHFIFEPRYMGGDGALVEGDFLCMLDHFGLIDNNYADTTSTKVRLNTELALDGGNVVDCEDKAIISWRVEEENEGLTKDEIRTIIQEALPGKDLCFIRNPPFEEDTTGHADGVVSFLDKDTIVIPDYGDLDDFLDRWDTIQACYPNAKLVELPNILPEEKKKKRESTLRDVLKRLIGSDSGHQRSKHKVPERFTSATGSTINLLMSDLGLYIPSFDSVNKPNDKQYKIIKDNLPAGKKIEKVDTGELSFMGGSVRCMSWQIYTNTETAQKLMNNNDVFQPKNRYNMEGLCEEGWTDWELWNILMGYWKKR